MNKTIPVLKQACEVYSNWDIEPPLLPSRSRLFRLEPIGIGTDKVESLSSYIARLAAEHCVSPRKLLYKEILEQAGKHTVHYSSSPYFSASQINGMGNLAEITITALERLTLCNDLHYTTLLMWKNILSSQQIMRTRRAWCDACYEEELRENKPIYDPLIWSLRAVAICFRHQKRLCEICPYCNHQLPSLDIFYRPGYCSRCYQWLGVASTSNHELSAKASAPPAEISQQLSIVHLIGELLASAPNTTTPLNATSFRANLAQYVNNEARRSINLFSNLVGIWSGTIRRLLLGQTKLRLEVLSQLCSRLNISPFNLLARIDNEEAFEISHLILERDIILLPNKVIPWNQVEDRLRVALKEDPPPSMEAIARCIGYYPPKIKRHFPEICKQIIARYKKHLRGSHPSPKDVRRAFRLALKEQPPPSLQYVLRRLGCRNTGSYYYENYRELCFKISRRYLDNRNKPFIKDADGKRLQAALIEYPPPSFSAVAKRLGHKREFVHKKFPELSKVVTSRYLHYQTALRKEKAKNLRYEIRKAIQQIVASGLHLSEARVKDAVKQHLQTLGRSSLFKQALCEVKLELGLAG